MAKLININQGTQGTATYAPSLKEDQTWPETKSDIKQKKLGDIIKYPYRDVSSILTGRFIVLEYNDLTRDKINFGYYGLVLRREDGGMDDIYFCRLYESELPSVVLEEGDIVSATLEQDEEQLGEYNFDDNTIIYIKLVNKLKWMKLK